MSSSVPSTRNGDVNTIKVLPSGTNLLAEERDDEHSYYRMSVSVSAMEKTKKQSKRTEHDTGKESRGGL